MRLRISLELSFPDMNCLLARFESGEEPRSRWQQYRAASEAQAPPRAWQNLSNGRIVAERIRRGDDLMSATESNNPSQIIRVSECKWEPMAPNIKAKTLWSDPASKRRAQLTRFEPGATLPMHRHVGDEFLYVIEGSISDEAGVTAAGSIGYRPNGCVHAVTSATGATVFAIISGGIEPVSERGNAPTSQTIVLSDTAWAEAMPGVRQKP